MLSTKVHPETSKQKTGSSGKSEEEGLSVWVEHTTSCFFFYAHDPNNVAVGPGYLGTHITLGKYRARGGGETDPAIKRHALFPPAHQLGNCAPPVAHNSSSWGKSGRRDG